MICPRCRAQISEGTQRCFTCGFSEAEVKRKLEMEVQGVTVSRFPIVNRCYRKIFGDTHKSIVKKFLKYCAVAFIIVLLFFHFFLYIDLRNGCFVTIRPALTELSNTTVKKGIKYLRKNFPKQYDDFCENVTSIDPNISCGGFGGGCYSASRRSNPSVIDISTTYGAVTNSAKVIIHETCHVIQFKEKRPFDEAECYAKDAVIPWNFGKTKSL